jgi:hypothetical protein
LDAPVSPVIWGTLIADSNGVVDFRRVRTLFSIALAIAGAVPLILAMLGVTWPGLAGCPGDHLPLGAGILVAPLTVGRATEFVRGLTSKGDGDGGNGPG